MSYLVLRACDHQAASYWFTFRVNFNFHQLAFAGPRQIVIKKVIAFQMANGFYNRFKILPRSGRKVRSARFREMQSKVP